MRNLLSFQLTLGLSLLSLSSQSPLVSFEESNGLLIVTDSEATPHEFPWLVSLQWAQGQYCTGVLLSPTAVLTTGYCSQINPAATYTEIYAGLHKLSENNTAEVQKRVAQTIIRHPGFPSEGYNGRKDDIAILKILATNPFVFDEFVNAISLPREGQGVPSSGVIAGWGSASEEQITLQETLMKAPVSIFPDSTCSSIYGEDFDSETMLCGGGVTGDFCNGDFGTGLVAEDEGGNKFLVGIASWGEGCGDEGKPGVYMKVEAFLSFIEANL